MGWEFAAPLPHSTNVPTRTMTYDDDNLSKLGFCSRGYLKDRVAIPLHDI
jgi:hypothetical protein